MGGCFFARLLHRYKPPHLPRVTHNAPYRVTR